MIAIAKCMRKLAQCGLRPVFSIWVVTRPMAAGFCMLTVITTSLAAATLETGALVAIVPPLEITLDLQGRDGSPTCTINGALQEHLHVALQWRTPTGEPQQEPHAINLQGDAIGLHAAESGFSSRFTIADLLDQTPPAPPSDTPLVMTLVICRE
jgi:hypothetical protein